MRPEVRELTIPVEGERVGLAADLMYPPVGATRHPVLVSMYPYHKDDVIGSINETPRRSLAEAGYATVLVDMRGHGASPGSPAAAFDLGGVEGADGAAVVEWVAGQEWCNGAVGMWGVSYGAMMAIATAARRPPHLRAVVAVYGTNDCGRDSMAPGDSPYALGRYSWAAHMIAMDLCPPTRQDDDGRWLTVWNEHLDRMRERPGHAFEWQQHVGDAAYWEPRRVDTAGIEVPTFLIGGWQDLYVDAVVRIFNELSAPRRLVVGPWPHSVPDVANHERFDWIGEMRRWWDKHLLQPPGPRGQKFPPGAPGRADDDPAALMYVNGLGRWRAYEEWPPKGEEIQLFLGPERGLGLSSWAQETEVHLDAGVLTGQAAGLLDPLGNGLGLPEDQHADDMASLTFDTMPLTDPLELAGRPELDLKLGRVASRDLRLVAKLCDVSPEGRSVLLSSGWARVRLEPLNEGNAPFIQLPFGPISAVVQAGHRVRLSVSSSDFPRLWPTPGNGSFSLAVGGADGSRVSLSVCSGVDGSRDWTDRLPRPPALPPATWNVGGRAVLRQIGEKPGGIVETDIESHNKLVTPSRAIVYIDEHFWARASALDTENARVFSDISFTIELANNAEVKIAVESEFSETAAKAKARVTLDGSLIFDESWQSPQEVSPAQPPVPPG